VVSYDVGYAWDSDYDSYLDFGDLFLDVLGVSGGLLFGTEYECLDDCPDTDPNGVALVIFSQYGPPICVSSANYVGLEGADVFDYSDDDIEVKLMSMNVNERGNRYEFSLITLFSSMILGLLFFINLW